jgi:uncharacterized protein YqjF (DUF2071 family)
MAVLNATAGVRSIMCGYRAGMSGRHPEARVRLPAFQQSWSRISFLHWPMPIEALASRLPSDLELDLIDGRAWVTLTPFEVRRFRLSVLPPAPLVANFPETNVRTYVRHRSGRDGLWFLSIDVGSRLNAVGGRLLGVPYHASEMSVDGDGVIRYQCRRLAGGARHDIRVAPGAPMEPDELTVRLTGRWRAFSRVAGQTLEVPVTHPPWPLRTAELASLDETLFAQAGLPAPVSSPLVHYSDGVDAAFGAPCPTRIRATVRGGSGCG